MFHVLEHLYDPRAYLAAAHELLAPDGRLVVQVPNAASWQFRLLGRAWNGVDVPRHLFDFRDSRPGEADRARAASKWCGANIFRCATIRRGWRAAWRRRSTPWRAACGAWRKARGARLAKDLVVSSRWWLAALPFTALEAACRRRITVMIEARASR